MGRTREGELSASTAAVLGLLIEQPEDTVGVERRLRERFFAAQFSPTTSHSAIKSLLRQRYICLYDGAATPVRAAGAGRAESASSGSPRPDLQVLGLPGLEPAADRGAYPSEDGEIYHATPEGLIVFWRWVRKSSSTPVIRDDLRTKVAFSRPEDTSRLIELTEIEEDECQANYKTLHKSLTAFEEHVDVESFNSGEDWSTLMLVGLIRDEAAIWFARMRQRERLREYLESLHEESLRRSNDAQRGR